MATQPMPTTTRIVTLASRPSGRPTPDNFRLDEQALPEPADGQLLVRNVYMSVDPSMRGRMDESEMHYTTNFTIGGPLDGSAVGEVLASRATGHRRRRPRAAPARLARVRDRRRRRGDQGRRRPGPAGHLARRARPDRLHRLRRAAARRRAARRRRRVRLGRGRGGGQRGRPVRPVARGITGDRQRRRPGEGAAAGRRTGLRRRHRLPRRAGQGARRRRARRHRPVLRQRRRRATRRGAVRAQPARPGRAVRRDLDDRLRHPARPACSTCCRPCSSD